MPVEKNELISALEQRVDDRRDALYALLDGPEKKDLMGYTPQMRQALSEIITEIRRQYPDLDPRTLMSASNSLKDDCTEQIQGERIEGGERGIPFHALKPHDPVPRKDRDIYDLIAGLCGYSL